MNKDNIIFMDGEFAKLKPDGIDLISIGLVKPNGEEIYLEIEFDGEIGSWETENVLPYFYKDKVSKEEAVKLIKEFVGNEKSYLVSYVNQFDWMGVCKLFNVKNVEDISNLPFNWVPIDLASILFNKGIKPVLSLLEIAKNLGIDTSSIKQHNALDDAKLLKEIYEKVVN